MTHPNYDLLAQGLTGVDWFYQFTNNLTALTTANGNALTSFGLTLLSFIAFMQLVKMVVSFSTSNMSFSINPAPLEGGEIVRFMLRLGFCCILETYWTNPIPGASWGFNKLFAAAAQQIVSVLDHQSATQLKTVLAEAWNKTGPPSLLSPFEMFEYLYVQALMSVVSGILFVQNISGVIFYAVAALFGPIFIPLYMVESFRGKFFGFVDALLSFAMLRAVAAAFVFVWGGFMTTFMQQTFNGDYSIGTWMANIVPVSMVMIAFAVNMLFIPQITQALFGGGAGATASAQNLATSVAMRYVGRGRQPQTRPQQ
jgi:type IV secretion system protein VirB6